jgi:CbiX protein
VPGVRLISFLVAGLLFSAPVFAESGILLLAHGGTAEWNARVADVARAVDRTEPTELAFGMATRSNIQAAVDRLIARGVTDIVAVPLFVSSWSSVVTATEYLLGLRATAPRDLALFAQMEHPEPAATGSEAAHAGHDAHDGEAANLGTTPIVSRVPIRRMTAALNGHPIVAQILTTRARSISRNPPEESVVLVAHGPSPDEENRLWLEDMATLAARMADADTFGSIDYLTLRDDAPPAVRNAATAQLQSVVRKAVDAGRRVLIVPLLLSFGGIEDGIKTRLAGLPYTLTDAALMPDDRLAAWVLEMAAQP